MIDASATAIGRGALAVSGTKNSGSQDAADAQGDGYDFDDYLEGAASDQSSDGAVGDDATTAVSSDGKSQGARARSVFTLFAVAQAGGQGEIDASVFRLAESGQTGVAGSVLGSGSDDARLARLLAGADGATSADQLAVLAAELQQSGQATDDIASPDDEQEAAAADGAELAASLLADFAATNGETESAAHRLLASLSKVLGDEDADEPSADDAAAEAGADASTTSLLDLAQPLLSTASTQSSDASAGATSRSADSVKDALAQVTQKSGDESAAVLDASVEDALKSARGADDVSVEGFDQVTVLESRRYLGFGGDNAKLLTTALANEANKALAPYTTVTDNTAQQTATTVNTLKIQMNPEHLGSMTASLRLKGDQLSVEVTVDTIEGYRHLAKDHSAIVQSLRDQGFSVDQVSIQLNPTPKAENQQQDQQQNGANQNLREGQGDAQRQQNNDGRSAVRNNWTATNDVQDQETGDTGGAVAAVDGLYL